MASSGDFKDLVEYIVKSLVNSPEDVFITETDENNSVLLEISVSEDDMGRLIGRGGVVVNSIRSLLQVAGAKRGKRVTLEIV
jgi:predicted RNA-binding protein YlqC (UPF0109 family)